MIRVILYLILLSLLAFAAVWFADRPGDVSVTWQGWRLETSVLMLVVAMAAVAVVAVMLWSLAVSIWRTPHTLARYLGARRGMRAYRAVSQGLIAIGSGDVRAARKFVEEANRHAPGEPLTLAARRADRAAHRRRRPGGARLPPDGGPRRYPAARPARPLHRGPAPRRCRDRAALRRGGVEAGAGAGLGRAGGAGIPLRHRRLGGRARSARAQHEERAGRQAVLSAPARRAAHRARARQRGNGTRPGAGLRARRRGGSRPRWCRPRRSPRACWARPATTGGPAASSRRRGRPTRIPIWPKATPI